MTNDTTLTRLRAANPVAHAPVLVNEPLFDWIVALPGETSTAPAPEVRSLDPELDRALRALRGSDREALLLVAWEDLTPTQAAAALGITPTAFRVRLYRARRRLRATLASSQPAPMPQLDVEGT